LLADTIEFRDFGRQQRDLVVELVLLVALGVDASADPVYFGLDGSNPSVLQSSFIGCSPFQF